MSLVSLSFACLLSVSASYGVPAESLVLILGAERGKAGEETKNTNDTYDLGPMQINSVHLPEIASILGKDEDTVRKLVRDDGCFNATVAAMLLRRHLNRDKDLYMAIGSYHSRTPALREKYLKRIENVARELNVPIGLPR